MKDNPRPAAGGRYVLDPLTNQPVPADVEPAPVPPEEVLDAPAPDPTGEPNIATKLPPRLRRPKE